MARTTPKARRGRGEGSIEFVEDKGLWKARLSLGFGADGRRVRRAVYAATKAEVREKLRRLQAEHDAGRLVDAEELTTGEFLSRWLVSAKEKTRPGTYEGYRHYAERYLIPSRVGVKLSKLRPLHVETAYASMSRTSAAGAKVSASPNTRRAAGVVLGIALRHAVRLKLIPSNPAAEVAKPKSAFREMKFMSAAQVKRFLEAAKSSRNFALYALALGSGMRQGELLGLKWPDIDFDKATVDVRRSLSQVKGDYALKEPKSRTSRRTVTLPAFVLDALREHRASALKAGHITAPVFASSAGTYLDRYSLLREFRTLIGKANTTTEADPIPATIRFHDLRHSHASCLIAGGASVKAVSHRLGHSDIVVTLKVYAHLMPDDDEKLAIQAGSLFG